MVVGFIVPILENIDIKKKYEEIENICAQNQIQYEVLFAFNGNANSTFVDVRKELADFDNIRAIKMDMTVDEDKLITVAMKYAEDYDATIIYSAKDEINYEAVTSFVNSWRAGNKIVYLKKKKKGFTGILSSIKEYFYKLGIKLLNVFTDNYAETDIQLLDKEVVQTINQLPCKNKQLRVLESFVGYDVDVVYTDIPQNSSKLYDIKSKHYWVNFATFTGFGAFTILFFVAALLTTILATSKIALALLFWGLFVISGAMAYIFFVKTVLVHRVGVLVDNHEIKALEERAEKYNLKK